MKPNGRQPAQCLILSGDLMFSSQAAQAARDAGYEVRMFNDAAALIDGCRLDETEAQPTVVVEGQPFLVLVDLTTPRFDPQQVARDLRTTSTGAPRLMAVGPHVHHAKLEAARTAGWQVFTRGQFHAQSARLLSEN